MLERQNLIDEKVRRVILVELHLALVCLWRTDGAVEQLDQHGEVLRVVGVQALVFLHLLVVKDVTHVLVQEKVVIFAQ